MATRIKLFIDKLTSNLKGLFLIDGLGAFLTAFLLVVMIGRFQDIFGMPRRVVHFLSLVACMYTIYSFSCYLFIRSKRRPYLKAIIIANIFYCCSTIGLVYYFYQGITTIGLIYFFLEVILMVGLIVMEIMALSKHQYPTIGGEINRIDFV